jgi:hypothetical protein
LKIQLAQQASMGRVEGMVASGYIFGPILRLQVFLVFLSLRQNKTRLTQILLQ